MKKNRILSVVPILMSTSPAVADSLGEYGHPHMYGDYGYGMFMGPVFMLVLLAALVVGIVALIRWIAPSVGLSEEKASNGALNALNLRFANGEIDAAEYAERKNLLTE